LGGICRVAGKPKARHSHLKPGATFALPIAVLGGHLFLGVGMLNLRSTVKSILNG
jgi:hypothetical protein